MRIRCDDVTYRNPVQLWTRSAGLEALEAQD